MNETADPIDEFLFQYEVLTCPAAMTQEELECQIQENIRREDWATILQLLSLAKDIISYSTARDCLIRAIHTAPPDTVSALLKLLPKGEYAEYDTYEVDWSPTGETYRRSKWEVCVQGTLVMHAVAVNRPDVLQQLLSCGYDVNGASTEAAAALLEYFAEAPDFETFQPHGCSPRPESRVCLRSWDANPNDVPAMGWDGATPLSLAVLLGHTECARILVEHGAWTEETHSVSRAMYLFWRTSDADYQAARRVVLEAVSPGSHRPALWALAPACSAEQLEEILTRYSYTQEELARTAYHVLWEFSSHRQLWKDCRQAAHTLCAKLYRIGQLCPNALCDPKTLGILLTRCCSIKELPLDLFLPFLTGKTLDISYLRIGSGWISHPEGTQMLETLAQHCTLVMERDAVSPGIQSGILRQLLKHTSFLPPVADTGISGLTMALLMNGNQRLIQRALETGIIWPGESTEELLLCQKQFPFSPACRMAVLTTPRPPAETIETPTVRPFSPGCRWFSHKLPDRSMPILTEKDWHKWLFPSLQQPSGFHEITISGETWQAHSVLLAACMAGRREIVAVLLEHTPQEELMTTDTLFCPSRSIRLWVTPLCAAAFAGQTEIVRILLDHGAPADEYSWGSPSIWMDCRHSRISLPFPPVSAAALTGSLETVELLTACGAVIRQNSH